MPKELRVAVESWSEFSRGDPSGVICLERQSIGMLAE